MRLQFLAITTLALAANSCRDSKADVHGLDGAPEEAVVCTGWHALCSASFDCTMNGDRADCDCMRVNEAHIVYTAEIKDLEVKRQTQTRCTREASCDVDEAPVCESIRNGQYTVDDVIYAWVSTYSYRGWCEILAQGFVPCDPGAPGYVGDLHWAVCDGAPCTENPNPSDPDRPLRCQCRLETSPFVGLGTCSGENGGIFSSFSLSAWDFQNNTYTLDMPGYEYVRGACEPVGSDPRPSE
mgnify:FL=1